MAIYKVKDEDNIGNYCYVISSGGTWLPGNYVSVQVARYAFQFPDAVLAYLQRKINSKLKPITLRHLRRAKKLYEKQQDIFK